MQRVLVFTARFKDLEDSFKSRQKKAFAPVGTMKSVRTDLVAAIRLCLRLKSPQKRLLSAVLKERASVPWSILLWPPSLPAYSTSLILNARLSQRAFPSSQFTRRRFLRSAESWHSIMCAILHPFNPYRIFPGAQKKLLKLEGFYARSDSWLPVCWAHILLRSSVPPELLLG